MENKDAVRLLGALAQESRLGIFRLLVQEGPEGLPAGKIGERLGIAPNTMSFHLKELSHAGLLVPHQQGRFIYYAANYAVMSRLMAFMTENCCRGDACGNALLTICEPDPSSPPIA